MSSPRFVWLVLGAGSAIPVAVFTSKRECKAWLPTHRTFDNTRVYRYPDGSYITNKDITDVTEEMFRARPGKYIRIPDDSE